MNINILVVTDRLSKEEHYDVEDYKKITGVQASALIEKFKSIES